MMATPAAHPSPGSLFTPKLVTVLREGYGLAQLRADALSGLTVAIVALPLSMAIAIASGVTPDRGLYAAIVGGFLVSLLGGSRFQIGGPAAAFIVLVATTVQAHGLDGLLLAVLLSGLILLAIGAFQLGTFIKYIPYPVTVGFTAGIGVIILVSQLKDFFGLTLAGPEPGPLLPKVMALADAWPSFQAPAILLSVLTVAVITACRTWRPHWPGMLIAVVLASALAALLGLPVETIGSRFGGIPSSLPLPQLPAWSLEQVLTMLPAAIAFALLGSIESLLSAVVADSMTGRRHRSNCELVAQGVANIASALFGGICVTGTIARTATNVRSGAHGPVSGMLHAMFLLVFMAVAAPLVSYVPLAALAGVLLTVAWNMFERHAIRTLLRASAGDAVVLGTTFLLTIFRDLTEAIVVGFGLAAVLFLHRMAEAVTVEGGGPMVEADRADDANGGRTPYDASLASDPDLAVYRISGAFFFGAAAGVGMALERIADQPRAYIIDFGAVAVFDSTAAATIEGFVRKVRGRGATVYIVGARPAIRRMLLMHGLRRPTVRYRSDLAEAVAAARTALAPAPQASLPTGVEA